MPVPPSGVLAMSDKRKRIDRASMLNELNERFARKLTDEDKKQDYGECAFNGLYVHERDETGCNWKALPYFRCPGYTAKEALQLAHAVEEEARVRYWLDELTPGESDSNGI